MSVLFEEIHEQPAALGRIFESGNAGALSAIAAAVKERDVRYVHLAARGTSDNAATYAKYLFQIVAGLPAGLAAPSVHTLYDARMDFRGALVIGVSQSGTGVDISEVVEKARRSGAVTVAVTNTPDSRLSQAAEFTLLCNAGPEKAVAATKTYTTSLAVLAALVAEVAGSGELKAALAQLPAIAASYLPTLKNATLELAETLTHAERLLTVARGLHLPTAIEAGLKLAETTGIAARAFSSADLLHGPIASVAAWTPCLLFAPKGRTETVMAEVAEKLRDRGARTIELPLADPGSELLSPILDILPAQLLAYHLTVLRGLDPDNPRGLTKVTITR
jgi:glucosamine--fructose-6-phosphate aminotransferase (isomerizing)